MPIRMGTNMAARNQEKHLSLGLANIWTVQIEKVIFLTSMKALSTVM